MSLRTESIECPEMFYCTNAISCWKVKVESSWTVSWSIKDDMTAAWMQQMQQKYQHILKLKRQYSLIINESQNDKYDCFQNNIIIIQANHRWHNNIGYPNVFCSTSSLSISSWNNRLYFERKSADFQSRMFFLCQAVKS